MDAQDVLLRDKAIAIPGHETFGKLGIRLDSNRRANVWRQPIRPLLIPKQRLPLAVS